MLNAPPGMRNGFFVSQLAFYDLQRTLARDTVLAIAVSLAVSLVVLLLVTLNLLVSLYTILSITCIIFVTVAVLVLMGWKLNVLESVAVSVAIGLAVDFSLHYAVNYRYNLLFYWDANIVSACSPYLKCNRSNKQEDSSPLYRMTVLHWDYYTLYFLTSVCNMTSWQWSNFWVAYFSKVK